MIEYIKEGFELTHRNWQVILIQIATMFIIFIGFILFVGVPLAIAFVYFGIDLTHVKDFLNIFKDPMGYLSRYLGIAILIITTFIIYICFAVILRVFVFSGTLGVLRNSFLDRQYKFNLPSFFKEGRSLFFSILGFAMLVFLLLIFISFILGILAGIGFSIVSEYGKDGTFIAMFIAYFLSLLLILIGIIIIIGVLTLSAYAVTILAVEKTGTINAFRKGFNFIKNKPKAILFCAILIGGYMLVKFILIMVNYPFSLIPLIGALITIPYQMFSYVLLNYLLIVMLSSLIIFYIKNRDYPVYEI